MNCFHYKILSVFIISLSLFTFPTNAKEYSSEIGTLWNFTVSKQINRINLQIQQNVWTLGKYYERYMPIAVVSYTAVPKYLNKWRNKILLSYTIPDTRWTPFIHTDIFLFLNGKQSGELDRIWYDAGVEYRIDKKNSIECKVREEHLMSKTPQQLNTFISLGYKLKL